MDSIPFYCFGISHRSATPELRAKLALGPDRQQTLLESIMASSATAGAVALSTCNRTEIYFSLGYPNSDEKEAKAKAKVEVEDEDED